MPDLEVRKMKPEEAGQRNKVGKKTQFIWKLLKYLKVKTEQICDVSERRYQPIPSFNMTEIVWTRNTMSQSLPSLLCPAGHLGKLKQIPDRIQFLNSFM